MGSGSFIVSRLNSPIIKPIVTSSGKRILSPMLINLPPPAMGSIFKVRARLRQKPAPPVANQKVIFLLVVVFFCGSKIREEKKRGKINGRTGL